MKSNTEQLAIAKKYVGYGGSKFRKFCGLPSGSAWCDAYVTTIFAEAGNASLFCNGTKQTYCPTTIKWCLKNLASVPPFLALPSDIIFFDWELNGVPNHIGFVRERKDCDTIYTIEGNTSGSICAQKTRNTKYVQGIFRPHFKPSAFDPNKALVIDGLFGYNSIAVTQRALKKKGVYSGDIDGILGQGTVKGIQKLCGASPIDGLWGVGTSKKLQKFLGVTADGLFGANSCKALQRWANAQVHPQQTTPQTRVMACAQKLIAQGFKYVKYNKNNLRPTNGGNCIRFVGKSYRDAGINVSDSASGLLNNAFADKMLKASASEALAMWKKRNGSNWEIIKDAKGVSESRMKPSDIIIGYKGNSYIHTALKGESGYIYDCCSNQGGAKKRKFSRLGCTPKIIFRYTGK